MKFGIEEWENIMFSEMVKENTCSLTMQFEETKKRKQPTNPKPNPKPKAKECPNWTPSREIKKNQKTKHSCGRAAGRGDSQKESSERKEKTHSGSLGKQFPFGKIKQEIITCMIWKLFTSTQYTTHFIYRVSDTKPGSCHVLHNLQVSTVEKRKCEAMQVFEI